jgi:hypothetical protein
MILLRVLPAVVVAVWFAHAIVTFLQGLAAALPAVTR